MKVVSIVDREGLAWTVASLVQELEGGQYSGQASVGVGVPGKDTGRGVYCITTSTCLCGGRGRKLFHKYLNIPLYIENDANCAMPWARDARASAL